MPTCGAPVGEGQKRTRTGLDPGAGGAAAVAAAEGVFSLIVTQA